MSDDTGFESPNAASLQYADTFAPEDEVLSRAREQAIALGGRTVSVGTGSILRFLASATGARHAVEVGTGTGLASLCLLQGMGPEGVLTSIDVEVDHQHVAKETLTAGGCKPTSFRLIAGRALDVLPRLTDAAYDLVLVSSDPAEYPFHLEQSLRLLRPGGVVAFTAGFLDGAVADPAQRDETTTAVRDLEREIQDNERLTQALIPVGDGLLVAVVN
ncbi:MAG: O-methyltransferase [Actinomycetia bacterium]|nr:O-methyltransferase [Actinomycetes bacterium]